ncbi:ATP-binding protein [Nocardiopsis mangrovi]|uniref:ATP-binding protein n=1 Tax=Nocardiopsis mangrovi TaxID=1179818 RepID=A0ABV9DUG8_9ACTN
MAGQRRRWSLAGQFLVFQLGIMVCVLAAVAAIPVAQSHGRFEEVEGRRFQAIAEQVGALPAVRLGLAQMLASPLAGTVQTTRDITGLTDIAIADENGVVLASDDSADIGRRLDIGESTALTGRSWIGAAPPHPSEPDAEPVLVAHAPVFDDSGRLVGLVTVGDGRPGWWEPVDSAAPYLLIYLGAAGGLGVLGSLLLASRIKRQTLGMEPRQIAATVEQREAMLHGVKEGVLGLDLDDRVTLANDQAVGLLGLPPDCVGRPLAGLGLDAELYGVLAGGGEGAEQVVLLADRVLTLNRMPMTSRGERIGSVTTLRDRTELVELRRELDVTRHTTDALRAQAHEFSNRLHTIAGLVVLGHYDEVEQFVTRTARAHERLTTDITEHVRDPSLAALLIAKAAMASERGVLLEIAPTSDLPEVDPDLSADLVTVTGNLIDNAFDALRPEGGGTVRVEVSRDGGGARVTVGDTGPGIADGLGDAIFRQGVTTKEAADGDPRGLGLAIIRLICRRRGGSVSVRSDGGALFTARLPATAAGAAAGSAGAREG